MPRTRTRLPARSARAARAHRAAARRAAVLAFAVLASWAHGAEDPSLVRTMEVPGGGLNGGLALAPMGDFDGDGIGDMAVGVSEFQGLGGRVFVLSGADGSALGEFAGDTSYDGFGSAVAVLGDVDGRGSPDVLVGAPRGEGGLPESQVPTYARLLAGEDGAVLFESGDMPANSRYGEVVALLGDLDGDAVPDFAVGRPERRGLQTSPPGSVFIHSGAGGGLLALISGAEAGDGLGTTVARVGDVDGDGVPDFVIGSPGASRGGRPEAGRLDLLSGATSTVIRSWQGRRAGERLGLATAVLSDASSGEFLIATNSSGPPGGRGSVLLLDASSGKRRRVLKAGPRVEFGVELCAVDDRDGDGVPELAVASGTVGEPGLLDGTALVEVYSSATGGPLLSWRGLAGDITGLVLAPGPDVDGDGVGELAVGIPARNAIAFFRPRSSPIPGCVRVALQRAAGGPDGDATGAVEFGPLAPSQPLRVTVTGLDEAAYFPPQVFLETAPGSGEYTEVGSMLATTSSFRDWVLEPVPGSWSPPALQRFATLPDFAGCRVEVRDPPGALLLEAVIPMAGAQEHRGRGRLDPVGPDAAPGARGVVRLTSTARRGDAALSVRTSGLPRDGELSVWIEDGPGGGSFTLAGALTRGRLDLDSRRGQRLPGAAPTGGTLAGRVVEVRSGAAALLRGTLP